MATRNENVQSMQSHGKRENVQSVGWLTFKEMVLQAAPSHEFIDEQPVLVLATVSDQLYKVGMPQLPEKYNLSLPFLIT